MKKLLLLPLLVLPLLTGCDGNKEVEKCRLTFGSKMQEGNKDAIKELSNSELLVKTRDQQEVFLLAVYQDQYSEECLCWKNTSYDLKNGQNCSVWNMMVRFSPLLPTKSVITAPSIIINSFFADDWKLMRQCPFSTTSISVHWLRMS